MRSASAHGLPAMPRVCVTLVALLAAAVSVSAHVYNATLDPWNLNKNQNATDAIDYTTTRSNTTYTPSPDNWRALPTYTLLLDKWIDGEPDNNDFFGMMYEYDWRETQLRAGGDALGLMDERGLDYLQSMGFKAIYIAGTYFLNMPWGSDGYSALDFTLLDPHYGNVTVWTNFIDALHARGMYIIVDFTVGTMGDLIGVKKYLNVSAPFNIDEYDVTWKLPTYPPWGIETYPDFNYTNEYNDSCVYPTFWQDDGSIIDPGKTGCYASTFDHYGDVEAFGVIADWQRQLGKFASVQDRLREWRPDTMDRLKVFSCLSIQALDIDGIRIDKATQVTVDALATWSNATKECARQYGKNNFFIPGEITGGETFGAVYVGRGRTPSNRPASFDAAVNVTEADSQYFIRDQGMVALDSAAFHYSTYRSLCRFLGMDGNLAVAYDVDTNFITAWNEMVVYDEFLNSETGEFDPRHMYGVTNQDVFRWPAMTNGTQRQLLGTFITTILMPGIPLAWYGEEQGLVIMDNGADNYLYGRQSMVSTKAWQNHGCYRLGGEQYYNLQYDKALVACFDDAQSLDHFDPTAEGRRTVRAMNWLRSQFPSLQDGFGLTTRGNWTHFIQLPGSNGTATELGMWSVTRQPLSVQEGSGSFDSNGTLDQTVWLIYTNENHSTTIEYDCSGSSWISSPYVAGNTVRNLLYPFETHTLDTSLSSYYEDGNAPYRGCLASIDLQPFEFKMFVPEAQWVQIPPSIAGFTPGHDARLASTDTIDITIEWDQPMDCDSVTAGISIGAYSGSSTTTPTIAALTDGACLSVDGTASLLVSTAPSAWRWSGQINNAGDGIYRIDIGNVSAQTGYGGYTGYTDHLLLRVGSDDNVMVYPDNDYSTTLLSVSDGTYTANHSAAGADKYRYSGNFGQTWSAWADYEQSTTLNASLFENNWWDGDHVLVQYWSAIAGSAAHAVHADAGYSGHQRRYPQFLARGAFNTWGYDLGVDANFELKDDATWTLPLSSAWPSYIQLNVWSFDDFYFGDMDGDGVLDRLPVNSLSANYLNMSLPPRPYLAWEITVNDKTREWSVKPIGHEFVSIIVFALLLTLPVITAFAAAAIFRYSFYSIKINKWGQKPSKETSYFPIAAAGATNEKAVVVSEKQSKTPAHIIGWPEDPNKRRCVLIATLEYEILDWKLKVKIGGLGVMSTLMGKAMSDVDLIWVVPKVQDLDYPQGDYAEPIEVIIFGEPYLIEVETHQVDNITYIILDSPVFRAQTKSDPYPQRMDDLSSAIFYSTWNQAIAETIRRFPQIDIYHVNDYHGALAPLYLLPKIMPVCLSLHNAEFQGLWPLRTKDEMKEVCAAFNIPKEVCSKYVQFGNTFNLLHAAASFISHHQKSVGVAGVSDKYGKRSWARYPALWTLRNIDSLPNPDPTDIAALDEQPIAVDKIQVDQEAEAKRPEQKRQAQEWAGIKQDPNSDLFVFVGRWSKQKGVDLIADVMPSLLEKKPSIQLICVGPVIDLYGRFAAEKLARLMEMYPDRVFSKPEFTSLPPYLFSGADFALIPSRDEPFGLVAVEFGRKGALGVGSRLGGLGLMPGWWFPVESSATVHMLSQLTKTIKLALKSSQEERAILRARSAVQRFPVVEWRQRLEDFQRRSISTSRQLAGEQAWGYDLATPGGFYTNQDNGSNASLARGEWGRPGTPDSSAPPSPMPDGTHAIPMHSPGQDYLAPRGGKKQNRTSAESFYDEEPQVAPLYDGQRQKPKFYSGYDDDESERYAGSSDQGDTTVVGSAHGPGQPASYDHFLAAANRQFAKNTGGRNVPDPFMERRMSQDSNFAPSRPFTTHSRVSSFDSISSIVDEKGSSPLNKAMETFTDADGEVATSFVQKLQSLSADNSKGDLCIEKFLMKSEKAFFSEMKKEKLSAASIRSRDSYITPKTPSMMDGFRPELYPAPTHYSASGHGHDEVYDTYDEPEPEKHMTRTQIFMDRSVGGWPLYTIVISFGQLLSATSFQLSLLSGSNTQTSTDLYIICSIFVVATVAWYTLFRMQPSVHVLALPWVIFGIAFFLIGLPSLHGVFNGPRLTITKVATWAYAAGSGAGFLFFGCNFGEEAGAATEVWITRACIVQGLQQIWVSALWYWGYTLNGTDPDTYTSPTAVICVTWPLAAMSALFAWLMYAGLPEYYHQIPPYVPNFFRTLFRRKLVIWFLISEVLRDYWLSTVYGRNWQYLWQSASVPSWAVVVMIAIFFVGVWGLLMGILIRYSKVHSWLLPVFAVGLGCPRWCQMFWGISGLGLYVPWAGSAGPYVGVSLWLWLGVLDAIQGVGLGMILLQTLSRLHVCATLAGAQLLGSIVTIVARATSPDKVGPANVFPDAAFFDGSSTYNPVAHWEFWLALACQIVIVIGYFVFFRKEQLSKP
ncbi:hypothetical protein Q5752_000233 [Cryptotrichosporon argae]